MDKRPSRGWLGVSLPVRIGIALLVAVAVPVVKSIANSPQPKAQGGVSGGLHDTAQTASLNESVRDQKFEFVVNSVACGKTEEGTEIPVGQYCEVLIQVTNDDVQPSAFDASGVSALDSDGLVYRADAAAGLMANLFSRNFLRDINPGDSVDGVVVFDVPKTTQLVKLELHDSPGSGGITVTLS
jgi:hypothetical protein